MASEIKVPTLPESIADATIVAWLKKEGDPVSRDEVLVEVETDKVVLEVPAAEDGVLGPIIEDEGATVTAHQVIGTIEAGSGALAGSDGAAAGAAESAAAGGAPAAAVSGDESAQTSPTVRKLLDKYELTPGDVKGSGRNGRILPEDVEAHVAAGGSRGTGVPAAATTAAAVTAATTTTAAATAAVAASGGSAPTGEAVVISGERAEKRVPMTRLRKRIAERLLSATQTTAMLTTFNEVDLSNFIALRSQYKDAFEKSHGIKLGFMSIFLKAATEALKRYPDINASIDGDDIVYHGYCDIGVAVSSDRGLVVPVVRNTENMSLADLEKAIAEYAVKARDGKLSIEEMTGGTFTVSNGGVFGSLLSTPILNPPQSAILGMHGTQQRPVAVNGEVVIRPMMYVALSYDHRIVDGKGAVGFLKTIKELVEEPGRIILDV
ncbi:MAG: dihydrolipoyllysine-residue succinyltransferase [Gammaproteobacteria bacterium]|nr:MAG: dihydrolipoyllysine-residue succinyltransferase [Gammaproteobacteria bacterium]